MSLPIDKAIRKAQSHITAGELAEAEELYKQVLSKFSKNKKAIQGYQKLKAGVTSNASSNSKPHQEQIRELINLYNQGQFEKVLEKVKPLISLFPKAINLHNIHGASNAALQRYDAAIDSYNQAIKIKPDYAEAYNNLGIALKDTGDFNAAIDSYKRAIKIKPDYADAYYNMGNALKGKGEFNAATDSYKQAIKIKPDYAEAYYNMGIALQDKGELDASIDSYKQAIKIKPDYAEAHNNMGAALTEKGELDAAIDSCKQAIKIKPDYAEAYYNMGIALKGKGELDATIDSCKQAIKIKPDYEIARTQKLHQQAHICDWAALEQDQHLISKLGTLTQYVDPFAVLSLEDAPERHRLRSELYAKQSFKQKPLPLAPRSTQMPDRLRIGYFSADFHNHATMYLMAKVFEAHDPEKFELYAYSFGPDKNDEMRQRLIHAVDVFDDVKEMSDKDIALLARQDKIDIAVDLKGFTKDQRTGIFAYCAAPIQISYLGYPGTMGADFIDYIIADKVVIPPIHQPFLQ